MQSDIQQRLDLVKDKYLQSSFGLWNALLTVNGIFLALFSSVPYIDDSLDTRVVPYIVGGCVLSLFLLVFNYVTIKSTYYRIGEVLVDAGETLIDQKCESDIQKALIRQMLVQFSELVCLFLLLVEAILILYLVIYKTISAT